LIRNTCYRTLMIRSMKSCWVFACDPELQGYLRQWLGYQLNRPKLCESRIDPEEGLYRYSQI
jgi:hypothetical protein